MVYLTQLLGLILMASYSQRGLDITQLIILLPEVEIWKACVMYKLGWAMRA